MTEKQLYAAYFRQFLNQQATFSVVLLAACCSWLVAVHALGQNSDAESVDKQSTQKEGKKMPEPEKFLGNCVVKWRGTVKTWFEPGKLADESKV